MKTKTFEKKLDLNKKTISNLKSREMAQIDGREDDPSTKEMFCTRIVTLCGIPC